MEVPLIDQLVEGASKGELEAVSGLLSALPAHRVNGRSVQGHTALYAAAHAGPSPFLLCPRPPSLARFDVVFTFL